MPLSLTNSWLIHTKFSFSSSAKLLQHPLQAHIAAIMEEFGSSDPQQNSKPTPTLPGLRYLWSHRLQLSWPCTGYTNSSLKSIKSQEPRPSTQIDGIFGLIE